MVPSLEIAMHETEIKRGLQALNSDINFDLGPRINKFHPREEEWQGVYLRGRHLTAMDRGEVPEHMVCRADSTGEIIKIGWRRLFHELMQKRVPGITKESLAAQFNIDWRREYRFQKTNEELKQLGA